MPAESVSLQSISARVGTLTPAQWGVIQANAEAAGDAASASVVARYAGGTSSPGIEARGLGGIVKAAVKAALKHGYQFLPKPIKPFASKILDVLETLEDWTEGPIISGLMAVGIPYDVAQSAAFWIATFAV